MSKKILTERSSRGISLAHPEADGTRGVYIESLEDVVSVARHV